MTKDKEKRRLTQQRYRERNKEKIDEKCRVIREVVDARKNVPCADCGNRYPTYCMDFDHLPGTEKKYNITHMRYQPRKVEAVIEEMDKCDVVCANCHRIRTHNRLQDAGTTPK